MLLHYLALLTIATEVFSLVVMGNGKQVLRIAVTGSRLVIAFVSSLFVCLSVCWCVPSIIKNE